MAPRRKSVTPADTSFLRAPLALDPIVRVHGKLRHGEFDAAFGPLTLIVGPNGSGKTSLVNALTLAIAGLAQDVAGQGTTTDDAALFRHLSHHGEPVIADVTTASNKTFWWRKESGRSAETHGLPRDLHTATFPLLTLRDALTGSNATVRKWVLDAAGRWITADALRSTIAAVGVTGVLGALPSNANPVAWLLTQEEEAASKKLTAARAQSVAEGIINQLTPQAGFPVTDDEIEQARQALGTAHRTEGLKAGERERLEAQVATIARETQERRTAYTAAMERRARAQGRRAELDAWIATQPIAVRPSDDRARVLTALHTFASAHREHFDGTCVLCGTQVPQSVMLPRLDGLLGQVHAMLNPTDVTAAARAESAACEAEERECDVIIRRVEEAHARAEMQYREIQARLALPDEMHADAATADTQAACDALVRRAALHRQIAEQRDALNTAVASASAAEVQVKAAKQVREMLLATATGALCKEVTRWLPKGWSFEVQTEETSIRIGLVLPDGQGFRSALSGAQEAAMHVAIACALAVGDVCVAIPTERQWSPEMLRDVMRAFEGAPIQIVLVSTIYPAGKISKGWTVVETGKKGAAADDSTDADVVAGLPAEPTAPVADLPAVHGPIADTSDDAVPTHATPDALFAPLTAETPTEAELAARARSLVKPVVQPNVPAWLPDAAMPAADIDNVRAFFDAQPQGRMPSVIDTYAMSGDVWSLFSDGTVVRTQAVSGLAAPQNRLWYRLHTDALRFAPVGAS